MGLAWKPGLSKLYSNLPDTVVFPPETRKKHKGELRKKKYLNYTASDEETVGAVH